MRILGVVPLKISPRFLSRLSPVILLGMVGLLYAQVLGHGFIAFDDGGYVTENPFVLKGLTWRGFKWACTTFTLSNYHPLTWLSYQLDVSLFGPRPGLMAMENALIHCCNAWLLTRIMTGLGFRWHESLFAGLVFAVHPLNVESVAWISQRKSQISTLMFFLATNLYIQRLRANTHKVSWIIVLLYSASLLAKPSAIVFPALLLVLDFWWLKQRSSENPVAVETHTIDQPNHDSGFWLQRVIEKWPLYITAVTLASLAYWAQKAGGSVVSLERMTIGYRLMNALQSIVNYLLDFSGWGMYVLFYPHSGWLPSSSLVSYSALIVAISGIGCWFHKRHPDLLAGWLWFLFLLLPTIGLIQVGSQSRADRYMYLPMIGLLWMLLHLARTSGKLMGPRLRSLLAVAAAVWIACLAMRSYRLIGYWKSSFLIANHTIQNVGDDPMPVSILASALARNGLWDKAIPLLENIVQKQPRNTGMALNLSLGYFRTGRGSDAIALAEVIHQQEPKNLKALAFLVEFYRGANDEAKAKSCILKYNQIALEQGFDAFSDALLSHIPGSTTEIPTSRGTP